MEELTLTEPVVEPEKVKNKLRVVAMMMNHDTIGASVPGQEPGLMTITLRDNYDALYSYSYTGKTATDFIKFINTANFTVNSLHKRILQRLTADGLIPGGGTVTGTPDPPAVVLEEVAQEEEPEEPVRAAPVPAKERKK